MPHTSTAAELAKMLAAKSISSVELTKHLLDRIKHHKELNAFITMDVENALAKAADADKQLALGSHGPLCGVPIVHKDLFCTEGVLTTCASKILSNFVSPYDATVIAKLKAAGTVMLAKSNMDEFAMGSSNETSYFGPVKNPWDLKTVPGGSSGGSAASVAARLTPLATGTDTGGSIRQPASFSGITGLKPTYGRVSRYGMVAFASSLDQAGPMTRSAEDAALVLNIIAGFDAKDSTSVNREVPDYTKTLNDDVAGLRIGLPKEFFGDGVDAEVAQAVDTAIKSFEKSGCTFVEVELPNSEAGIPCYYVLAPAEASSNLARFDGVRYGFRAQGYEDLNDLYSKSRAQGFGEEVKRRIMIGTYVLSSGYYDAYYIKAQRLRRMITQDYRTAFKKCDVIMGPTAPTTAFELNAKTGDPVAMYLNDIFTNSVNLAGLPGISIPCGFDGHGRPAGLQIIGNYFEEARLLNVAHQYQQATDWHSRVPEGFA